MNKTPSLVKYSKLSRTLLIITNVSYWIVLILTILFVLAGIVVRFLPESLLVIAFSSNGTFGLSPDNTIQFDIPIENISNTDLVTISSAFFLGVSLVLLLAAIILRQLRFVVMNVAANKPFHEKSAIGIKNIGYTVIASSLIIPIAKAFVISKILDSFNLPHVSVVYSINVEILFVGILLILLSAIFQYGAYLQQEYDTTL